MDADRRAEIIQAVEWHDRDLLSEIQRLEAEVARLKDENAKLKSDLENLDWNYRLKEISG